jgi:hypothetical protein
MAGQLPATPPDGQAQNRRIEVVLMKQGPEAGALPASTMNRVLPYLRARWFLTLVGRCCWRRSCGSSALWSPFQNIDHCQRHRSDWSASSVIMIAGASETCSAMQASQSGVRAGAGRAVAARPTSTRLRKTPGVREENCEDSTSAFGRRSPP